LEAAKAVIAVDAVLVGTWYSNRSRKESKRSTVCSNFEGAAAF